MLKPTRLQKEILRSFEEDEREWLSSLDLLWQLKERGISATKDQLIAEIMQLQANDLAIVHMLDFDGGTLGFSSRLTARGRHWAKAMHLV